MPSGSRVCLRPDEVQPHEGKPSNMKDIRVRIAPSPTGFVHIGTARTALFNWLFARKHGGTFILRLEDTDTERSTQEFADIILDGLRWLGIDWDEGPGIELETDRGEYGPYRQSQRKQLYAREVDRLLETGAAFKCFHTKEELDAMREQARAEKRSEPFRSKWRDASPEDVAAQGDAPYAVRFKVPEGVTEIEDIIQGTVRVDNTEIDDFVIVKPNGDPIFHLAVVVDDVLMKISHVIRGDDHLSNTPRHVMLFNALGYEPPVFAHLPMVLTESGKKLSKRDMGANLLDWREKGYLPETLVNYIAFLGWNPGDDRELLTLDELAHEFTLERVSKAGAKFDMKRLQFLNGQHIRRLAVEDLRDRLVPILEAAGLDTSMKTPEWLAQMAAICQEKLATLNDIVEKVDFFFVEPEEYEEKAVKKRWQKEGVLDRMHLMRERCADVEPWTHDTLKAAFEKLAQEAESGLGPFVHPARLAWTGKSVGPGLFELAELLGKDACLARLDKAIAYLAALGEAS